MVSYMRAKRIAIEMLIEDLKSEMMKADSVWDVSHHSRYADTIALNKGENEHTYQQTCKLCVSVAGPLRTEGIRRPAESLSVLPR
jgi:hypothetical protein